MKAVKELPKVTKSVKNWGKAPDSNSLLTSTRSRIEKLSDSEKSLIKSVETFQPNGVSNADAMKFIKNTPEGQKMFDSALKSAGPDADINSVLRRTAGLVESGLASPVIKEISTPLVKIVPKGEKVSAYSPYFTT